MADFIFVKHGSPQNKKKNGAVYGRRFEPCADQISGEAASKFKFFFGSEFSAQQKFVSG